MHQIKPTWAKKLSTALVAVALAVPAAGVVPQGSGQQGTVAPLGADGGSGCTEIVAISPKDRYHVPPGQAGETFCHRIDLYDCGVLLVGAATPVVDSAEAKLRLSAPAEGDGVEVVERSPGQLILRVCRPGAYVFEVASQDPRRALGEHTFTSRFVADSDAVAVELGQAWYKDHEDGEIDPILVVSTPREDGSDDTYRFEVRRPGVVFSPADGRAALVRPGEEWPVPAGENGPPALHFYDLCRLDLTDDHDALFACASPVRPEERVHGELVNGQADDHDVFTFVLAEQRTVRLETRGPVEIVGALYDGGGNRLAAAGDRGAEGNFRLVRTLAPGRYFVRIGGRSGAEGPYSLIFATLPW